MSEEFEFAEKITVSSSFVGEPFTEVLGPGTVKPKNERQELACKVAVESVPDLVKVKKGKSS